MPLKLRRWSRNMNLWLLTSSNGLSKPLSSWTTANLPTHSLVCSNSYRHSTPTAQWRNHPSKNLFFLKKPINASLIKQLEVVYTCPSQAMRGLVMFGYFAFSASFLVTCPSGVPKLCPTSTFCGMIVLFLPFLKKAFPWFSWRTQSLDAVWLVRRDRSDFSWASVAQGACFGAIFVVAEVPKTPFTKNNP